MSGTVKAEDQPLGDPQQTSVARSSLIMAIGTLLSRVLGFARWTLLIAAIGALAANDAFQVANNLPNMVYNLLAAGLLDAILVPQIVRAFKTANGSTYVNRLITLAGTVLFGITLLTLVLAAVLVNIFAAEMAPAWKSLAVVFSLWCLPQIFFYGLYNLLGETLNARGIFGPYTWVPVVNNVIGIVGLIVFILVYGPATDVHDASIWTFERTALLAGPATLGVIVQALLLFIPLRNAGIKLRPDFHFRGAGLGAASKIAGWVFAVLLVNQVSVISSMNIGAAASAWRDATGQFAPAVTAINFTFMIYMMPQSIIATSIAIAMFTRIASAVADNDLTAVANDFHMGVRTTTIMNLWAAAILGAGSIPIFQALAPLAGREVVVSTAFALVAMLPGLAAAAISMFASRVFFALEDGRPVFISVLGPTIVFVAVSWILKATLPGYLWVTAVLFAEAIARLAMAWLSLKFVAQRIPQVNKPRVYRDTLIYSVNAIIAAAVAVAVLWPFGLYAPGESYGVQLMGAAWRGLTIVFVITVIYVLLMAVFDRRGFDAVFNTLGNRIPIVKKMMRLVPAVTLPGPLAKIGEDLAEPVSTPDFFEPGNDSTQPVWFSNELAAQPAVTAATEKQATLALQEARTLKDSEAPQAPVDGQADPADEQPESPLQRIGSQVFEKLYQWSLWMQPAPVKHAQAEAVVLPEAEPNLESEPEGEPAPAEAELASEPEGEVAPVTDIEPVTEDAPVAEIPVTEVLEAAPSETKIPKRSTNLALPTRSLTQSLERARGTVEDLQAGKEIDPTRPTIILFIIITIVMTALAAATLGLLPSGGSHIDKSAPHEGPAHSSFVQ